MHPSSALVLTACSRLRSGAANPALEEGIPITDPAFYVNESLCPDSLLAHVFRPAERCAEPIPLLQERISILRQNGFILCAVRRVHTRVLGPPGRASAQK